MCVYAYTFTYLCVCIYIYICARTHTHTYTRSRNQSDSFQFYTSGCLPYTAAPRWPLPCGCGQLVWLCWSSYLHGQCRNVTVRTGNVAQVVECLPSKHKVMSSWPKKKKKKMPQWIPQAQCDILQFMPASACFIYFVLVLGFELRTSCLLGRHSTTSATPPACFKPTNPR
jgi:hypothetical protein